MTLLFVWCLCAGIVSLLAEDVGRIHFSDGDMVKNFEKLTDVFKERFCNGLEKMAEKIKADGEPEWFLKLPEFYQNRVRARLKQLARKCEEFLSGDYPAE